METKKKKKFIRKLNNHYRLMIYDDNTFQAVWNFRITRIKVIRWVILIIAPIIAITILLIVFTPIRVLIPGYPEPGMRKKLIQNIALIDSLQNELHLQQQYLVSIQSVISGKIVPEELPIVDTVQYTVPDLPDYNFNHDSIFKLHLLTTPTADGQNAKNQINDAAIKEMNFFKPINGIITDQFNASSAHYGIDITSSPEAPIFAVLSGTVIYAGFDAETGYIMYIQHNNNLVSVYKHNFNLLKKTGDTVKAGDTIAIMGNTGELTTGPHLHFELWYKGKAVNPSNYIRFKENIRNKN